VRARDAYWQVVQEELQLSLEQQEELLLEAIARNPFIAEPEVLLAQLYFRGGDMGAAAEHSARALEKFVALGSAWDKRLPFNTWVAFARVLQLRARSADGGLPVHHDSPVGMNGRRMVDLKELVSLL
jgi:hypothetical protein